MHTVNNCDTQVQETRALMPNTDLGRVLGIVDFNAVVVSYDRKDLRWNTQTAPCGYQCASTLGSGTFSPTLAASRQGGRRKPWRCCLHLQEGNDTCSEGWHAIVRIGARGKRFVASNSTSLQRWDRKGQGDTIAAGSAAVRAACSRASGKTRQLVVSW